VVLARLRYVNAGDPAAMAAGEQARCLKLLEQVHAMGAAAHASVLGAFTAGQGSTEDGEDSPRSWLIHRADVTRAAAWAYTAWSRRAEAHPKIRQAMAGGILSESWGRAELRALDDGSALQGEWIAAAAARWAAHRAAASVTGSDGGAWLAGRAAQAVACDAILVPVVTGDIDPAALDDLVRPCVELHRLPWAYETPGDNGHPSPGSKSPAQATTAWRGAAT
jgi:hypothetical protein